MRTLLRTIALGLIRLYQRTLSPDHGWMKSRFPYGACKFYPTCSQYTATAISRFGVVRGFWLGIKRLTRCHPFRQPDVDDVPRTFSFFSHHTQ